MSSVSDNKHALHYHEERTRDSTYRYRCRKRSLLVSRYMAAKTVVWLDIGCGDGLMFNLVESRSRVRIGVDLNLSLLRFAKEKVRCSLVRADAHAIPLRDQSVDFTSCTAVLEHLSRPEITVIEIHRVLKNRRLVIATVPNPFAERVAMFTGHRTDVEGHIQHFSLKALEELFRSRSFFIEKSGRYLFPHMKVPLSHFLENMFGSLIGVVNYVVARKQEEPCCKLLEVR